MEPRAFHYYARRLSLVCSVLYAVWCLDSTGALGLIPIPWSFHLGDWAIAPLWGTLSCWCYYQTALIATQLRQPYPNWLWHLLWTVPIVYPFGALGFAIAVEVTQRQALVHVWRLYIACFCCIYGTLLPLISRRLRKELTSSSNTRRCCTALPMAPLPPVTAMAMATPPRRRRRRSSM